MPIIHHGPLRQLTQALLEKSGSQADEVRDVADHLVDANLVGHDSHGVLRMRDYLSWLREGMVLPNRKLEVVFQTDTLAIADGELGYGQRVGIEAVRLGMEKCRKNGISLIALRNCAHLGRVGHWAEMAAAEGLVSLHFVSTNGFGVLVAPFGGADRRLSANPMSIGIPRGDETPLILDISTCAIAEGKIKVARNRGKPVPPGCIVNAAGQPTTDAEAFYADPPGSILPMGGHKGYGLSLCVELLAGALTGNGCSQHARPQLEQGMLSLYIDPEHLQRAESFLQEADAFLAFVKSARRLVADQDILVPGEREARTRAERTRDGIPLDDITWQHLVAEAEYYSLSMEQYGTG